MQPNEVVYPSLRARKVRVTGGANGIGAVIVAHFCAQGSLVPFLDIADAAAVALAEQIGAAAKLSPCGRD